MLGVASLMEEPVHVFVRRLCSLLDAYRWLLDSYVIVSVVLCAHSYQYNCCLLTV